MEGKGKGAGAAWWSKKLEGERERELSPKNGSGLNIASAKGVARCWRWDLIFCFGLCDFFPPCIWYPHWHWTLSLIDWLTNFTHTTGAEQAPCMYKFFKLLLLLLLVAMYCLDRLGDSMYLQCSSSDPGASGRTFKLKQRGKFIWSGLQGCSFQRNHHRPLEFSNDVFWGSLPSYPPLVSLLKCIVQMLHI